jgi:hypothetical protein
VNRICEPSAKSARTLIVTFRFLPARLALMRNGTRDSRTSWQ